jgi:hypothetical protein
MPTHDKRTVGRRFEIDNRAMKIFEGWLPDDWIHRRLHPDFHIDYLIETVKAGELEGIYFGVQVKGVSKLKLPASPKHAMKTKHLRYYPKCPFPVFVFVIDISKRAGNWLFAQKFIKEQLSYKILHKQKTATLQFQSENNLKSRVRFQQALLAANQYVHDLNPGSIDAALKEYVKELQAKDKRVEVDVSIKDGKTHIVATPKEVFQFTTRFKSKDKKKLKIDLRNWIERGKNIKVKAKDFEVKGAPILEEAVKKMGDGDMIFEHCNKQTGSIQFIRPDSECPCFVQVDGQFRGGTKYTSFNGELANSPLTVAFELGFEELKARKVINLSIKFPLERWEGQSVMFLSCFDQINELIQAGLIKTGMQLRVFINGNLLQNYSMNEINIPNIEALAQSFAWLKKCKFIAEKLRVNLVLPVLKSITFAQRQMIHVAHELLQGEEVRQSASFGKFSGTVSVSATQIKITNEITSHRIVMPEIQLDCLGTKVRLGPVGNEFTQAIITSVTPNDANSSKIVIQGTEKTERVFVLLNPAIPHAKIIE